MKTLKTAFVIGALALSGCVMKQKILDAGAVSMTHQSLKEGQSLKETGPVKGEYCTDITGDKGNIGLMDEAIKNAQQQNSVDYITNATFYSTGKCILVEGTGQKVMETASAARPAAAPEAPMHSAPAAKAKTKKN